MVVSTLVALFCFLAVEANSSICFEQCIYNGRLCNYGRCAFLPSVEEREGCERRCSEGRTACDTQCKALSASCALQKQTCEAQCSPYMRNRDKCAQLCVQAETCCTSGAEEVDLQNMCGGVCAQRSEMCQARCTFVPSANERNTCLKGCRSASQQCAADCAKAEVSCNQIYNECDEACPLVFKNECRKICEEKRTCCATFPPAPSTAATEFV